MYTVLVFASKLEHDRFESVVQYNGILAVTITEVLI